MANLNKVLLMGRLTRDPEARPVGSTKVVKFGFAVNNRRKDSQSGEWVDDPVFLDVEVWDRGENRAASNAEERLRNGSAVFIEGKLKYEQWTVQDGTKRSALRVTADSIQYLDPKSDGQPAARPAQQKRSTRGDHHYESYPEPSSKDEIPF